MITPEIMQWTLEKLEANLDLAGSDNTTQSGGNTKPRPGTSGRDFKPNRGSGGTSSVDNYSAGDIRQISKQTSNGVSNYTITMDDGSVHRINEDQWNTLNDGMYEF